jgi:hypothetical protein
MFDEMGFGRRKFLHSLVAKIQVSSPFDIQKRAGASIGAIICCGGTFR